MSSCFLKLLIKYFRTKSTQWDNPTEYTVGLSHCVLPEDLKLIQILLFCFEYFQMPRKPKERKIANFTAEDMRKAVAFIEEGASLRRAQDRFGISKTTLQRYVIKKKVEEHPRMEPNYAINRVFSNEEEEQLKCYISTCAKMAYGLNTKLVKNLGFQLAVANNKKIPDSWNRQRAAGDDWLRAFLKRNNLSIRQPEGCSLSRMSSFNRHNVSLFFENLKAILRKDPKLTDPSRIFNLDETGTKTVQNPRKVIADKGIKQVSSCTSGERGVLVTTCAIISAAGTFLPPAMVFPRKHFKPHMLTGAPPGTLGLASPSGWMNAEIFPAVLQHFIDKSYSTKENPSLLILDNLEAHITIEVINMARAAGVTILTLPPHCSHKLQPLDKTVFSPFKTAYDASCETWLLNHPGIPLTIYSIAELVNIAFDKAFTPKNIKAGFAKTGIFPFNENIFVDADFIESAVTDRPQPDTEVEQEPLLVINESFETLNENLNTPSTSTNQLNTNQCSVLKFVSPEAIRAYPKAAARKTQRKQTRKRKSTVITSTPEKENIESQQEQKNKKNVNRIKRTIFNDGDTSEDEIINEITNDESDDGNLADLISSSESEHEEPEEFFENPNPIINSWVLVHFEGRKGSDLFYAGQVIDIKGTQIAVNFLKKGTKQYNFPLVKDEAIVDISQIKKILPEPELRRGYYNFKINFPRSLNLV